jgi:DNA primase
MISQILPSNRYLMRERKLSEESILAWHLGYCDSQGEVYIDADFQGQLPVLDKRFYNSTIFPVYDLHGSVVSVSARPLGQSAIKYVNTSYEKANHLYGLNLTYKNILKTQKVYVAEGNLSAITPWQHGLKNVVALLGINISHTQLCLLNRFAKQVCFMVDADKAGENFIEKMRQQIPSKYFDTDMKFSFVTFPKGQDPDSYFQDHTLKDFLDIPEQELNI